MKLLKKLFDSLFSTSAAGLYIILFAVSIGVATFVENDFGTSAAQKVIFKARWFELLLVMFSITLIVNIFRFRMVQQKKWPLLIFHASMVIIIFGAGVTRYFGKEGMMGIREGSASNSFLSAETYLQFQVMNEGKNFRIDEPVLFASLGDNSIKKSYLLGGKELKVEVKDFIPNPTETMVDDDNGLPTLKVVIAGRGGREEYLVQRGQNSNIYGTLFNFGGTELPQAFNIKYQNDSLYFMAPTTFSQMVMATQTKDTLASGMYHPLRLRSMYSDGMHSFVFGAFSPHARAAVTSSSKKMNSNSMGGVGLSVTFDGVEKTAFVAGAQGVEGEPKILPFGSSSVGVSYGARRVALPFSIKLNDFIMERYPGTNNASSYASEVTLMDQRKNLVKDQRIFMNNILDYDGYRFFQSSFDKDELGTYLSVNFDAPGTWISYIGYALLTLGMIWTFFSKKTRFAQLSKNLKNMRNTPEKLVTAVMVGLFLAFSTPSNCENAPLPAVDKAHADAFGRILIQDYQGRFKPMNTFAGEVLRKLAKKETLYGQSAEQVILGMAANPKAWYDVPLIKLGKHEEIRKILGVDGEMAKFGDFFDQNGDYKMREVVRTAYNTPQRDRSVFDKEVMKLDEKLNICSMVFSGRFMKVFPVPNDTTHTWQAAVPDDPSGMLDSKFAGSIIETFYPAYVPVLKSSMQSKDWALANRMLSELDKYQHRYGGDVLPSKGKIKAELILNKLNIFNRLSGVYGLLSLLFLGLLFTGVFNPNINLKALNKIAFGILVFGFFMHTLGLGLRWYVGGRAPWSNGYESMVYIGWTTTLAGLIFARKANGGLAATTVLAAVILMVAGMNWLDPEITPLVPVLKSYWLMIHVSLEAGSYGFLALGAIIGVLNLVFMIFGNQKNGERVYRIVKELTYTSEMTLIGGLFMVSIGTYLGGIWANESWGRYWGWDAKETWALVTILVYAFILHMRFIPGFRGVYAFNVSTLFGWATVMMTYFGVNYYLSGLHSYAAGDPVPIPAWVHWTVGALTVLSLVAWWRHRAYQKGLKNV
ncbi:MAG: cytochrome c biogenesis protein CcsA [Saprospiraceae bacterium]|nr:cytochrome c biogenesis protein CcsA [Saprospiraceae bacterium]MCF8250346.1 cytochrome c biogenesis protein CcsA [Saprospiraceae bacterium]MCF8280417.1 cytochrome c biogenesis protein CcsA [Bacteroidales bacterium]MCF8312154.1 cytochrome c biogenesis protein CcsA [Saprospiraceae bacterium]MCF8441882.1 cytochrome c biogenesis protein CcsA [Saprospiraceae bacterium]